MALKLNKERSSFVEPVKKEDNIYTIDESVLESFRLTPPLYHGNVLLSDYGTTARSGMRVKFRLDSIDEKLRHPFCGLKFGINGHRLRIVVSNEDITRDELGYSTHERVIFFGDSIMVRWDDNPSDGMTVTVRLDEPESGIHPFSGLLSGKTGGTMLWFTCWPLSETEMAEETEVAKKTARPWNTLDATTQSNIKCSDASFQKWISEIYIHLLSSVDMEYGDLIELTGRNLASEVIRRYCSIKSRREFKDDTSLGQYARQQWMQMMSMYENWMRYGS